MLKLKFVSIVRLVSASCPHNLILAWCVFTRQAPVLIGETSACRSLDAQKASTPMPLSPAVDYQRCVL